MRFYIGIFPPRRNEGRKEWIMEKMTLTRAEAAKMLQVSVPKLNSYLRRADNPLPSINLNTETKRCKVLIPAASLARWIEEEAARNAEKAVSR